MEQQMNAQDNPLFFENTNMQQDAYEKAAADWEFGYPQEASNRRFNPIDEDNDRMKRTAHA